MTDRPDAGLLAAARLLRSQVELVALPLDVEGVATARLARRELLGQLDDYVLPRLADLDAPLLAVVGGSTGAGKSTLVNTLARHVVSRPGVLRPTTRACVLVHHPDDRRWFDTPRVLPHLARITSSSITAEDPSSIRLAPSSGLPAGVAILDAPDVDSVVAANRDLSRQLLAAADLWLFVTTAARYADAVPWDLLRVAVERGTSVAIILDRVPREALDLIADHLGSMLVEQGLPHAPVFTVAESTLDEEGLIPEAEIADLREWLSRLGEDSRARTIVVRRTLAGALASLDTRLEDLAEASFLQVQTLEQMEAIVTSSFGEALEAVSAGIGDGTLLRGEVLSRWQEFVGTGELFRQVEAGVSRLRDRIAGLFTGTPPAPSGDLGEALQSGAAELIMAHAEAAITAINRRWRGVPGGTALALNQPGLATMPADLRDRVQLLVRDWQGDILDLVREEGQDRRTSARILSFGINAVGVVLMLVVFSYTAGISGAEVGIAGGSALVAQRLLEAIFGDQAVRTLAIRSRELLLERTGALYAQERARFDTVLAGYQLDVGTPRQLLEAASAVRRARS